MDKTLRIAVILTAYDKMSQAIAEASTKSQAKLKALRAESAKYMGQAFAYGGASAIGFNFLHNTSDAFAELQDASLKMRSSMMKDGGLLDEATFQKLDQFTNTISARFTGSAADYKKMVTVMQENGLQAQDILGGTGEAAAKLAVAFEAAPDSIAQFAARMRQDMGIANQDMEKMTDLIARLHNAGVGKDGAEAVNEMSEAFSKAGLGAANLGMKGIEAAKGLGAMMGIFVKRGISGGTVGNNFRRIFDGLRDADKIKKANQYAKEFGITLDFYKNGKFGSVENFVAQIGKLQGLSTTAISKVLKPFSGKQGLSTDFLEFMAKEGTSGFNEMQHKLSNQATLDQKVRNILSGQKKQAEIARTSWTNAMAAIGRSLSPVINWFNRMKNAVANFISEHPRLAKFIAIFVSLTSAALGMMAIVSVIKAIRAVMLMLNIVMAANPFIIVVAAVIVVVSLIYTYWDKIRGFFIWLWAKIKSIFSGFWNWVKGLIMKYTPAGLIFSHWDKIKAFFHNLWEKVKHIFMAHVAWVMGLGAKFFNAGKNIVMSIWNGIKNFVHKPIQAIKDMVTKIRKYLPFSPAKEGPLRDIHKIRLVETIAESIRVNPVIQAMQRVGKAIFETSPSPGPLGIAAGGGNVYNIHFSPVLNGNGGDLISQLKACMPDLMKLIQDSTDKQSRRRF
jgi:TP901 family phage tail tape measure protein